MNETTHTVPTVQSDNHAQTQTGEADAIDVLLQEFGQEAGKRVGNAIAEEIHNDPQVRRAAATGAGVGLGIVAGLALLSRLD